MSHFCVLVIGNDLKNNIDEILQPYSENNRKYFQPTDVTDEFIKDYNKYKDSENTTFLEFCKSLSGSDSINTDEIDKFIKEKQSFIEIDKDNNVIKFIQYYNKNSKWNWYEIGGNYTGRIIQKDGSVSNFTKFSNFDIELSRQNNIESYNSCWENLLVKLRQNKALEYLTDKELDDLRYNIFKEREHLQTLYNEEVQSGNNIHLWDWIKTQDSIYDKATLRLDLSDVECSSEYKTFGEFVNNLPPLTVYAILDDTGWNSRGDMGWFGVSYDKLKMSEWYKIVNTKLNNLKPDDELMLIDCHI